MLLTTRVIISIVGVAASALKAKQEIRETENRALAATAWFATLDLSLDLMLASLYSVNI